MRILRDAEKCVFVIAHNNWSCDHPKEDLWKVPRFLSLQNQLKQELKLNDNQALRTFADTELADAPGFHKEILFSVEAHYSLNDIIDVPLNN